MSGAEDFLCELLGCGSLDVAMLDDVDMDWADVIERAGNELTFSSVMYAVISIGIDHIRDKIEDRISELESVEGLEEGDLGTEEQEELDALKELDPESDIEMFLNFLDTHAYFSSGADQETYQKYLKEALDDFYDETGFELETWG